MMGIPFRLPPFKMGWVPAPGVAIGLGASSRCGVGAGRPHGLRRGWDLLHCGDGAGCLPRCGDGAWVEMRLGLPSKLCQCCSPQGGDGAGCLPRYEEYRAALFEDRAAPSPGWRLVEPGSEDCGPPAHLSQGLFGPPPWGGILSLPRYKEYSPPGPPFWYLGCPV